MVTATRHRPLSCVSLRTPSHQPVPTLGDAGLIIKAKLWKVGVSPFKVSVPAFVWPDGVMGVVRLGVGTLNKSTELPKGE